MELDEELRQNIMELLKKGKLIPESYKNLLFPVEKKPEEIELVYAKKERKEDVFADTMSIPFQVVKQFGKVKEARSARKDLTDRIRAMMPAFSILPRLLFQNGATPECTAGAGNCLTRFSHLKSFSRLIKTTTGNFRRSIVMLTSHSNCHP